MTQYHKNLVVLGLALLLSGAVIAWVVFVNKGTLAISANTSFSATVSGGHGSTDSDGNALQKRLRPGEYSVLLSKEDYFSQEHAVSIKRFNTTNLDVKLVKVPRLETGRDYAIPAFSARLENVRHNIAYAPITMPSTHFTSLEALLKKHADAKFVHISADGAYVFIVRKNNTAHIYELASEKERVEIVITDFVTATWHPDGSGIYIMHQDATFNKQMLSFIAVPSGKREIVTSFLRPFTDGALFVDPQGNNMIIAEHTEEGSVLYSLDLQELRKVKILETGRVADLIWSPQAKRMVYQINSPKGYPLLFTWQPGSSESTPFDVPLPLTIMRFLDDDSLIAIANFVIEEYLAQQDEKSIQIFTDKIKLITDGPEALEESKLLHYSFNTDHWQNFLLKDTAPAGLSRISVDHANAHVYLHAKGKRYTLPYHL